MHKPSKNLTRKLATVKSFKANVRNVSLETLCGVQFTLSTQLIIKKKGEREKEKKLKEMVRSIPEGIVYFSLTLSDPFHGTKENL